MSGVESNIARRIRKGATLPATCSPGEIFGKTSGGSEGLYFCVTANAWVGPFVAGSVGITNSAGAGVIPYTSDGSGNLAASPLSRVDANIVQQKNGSTAQEFRIYDNTTDYGGFRWAFDALFIESLFASRPLVFNSGGIIYFQIGGATSWYIPATSHFLAGTDNASDIGAAGANRPRNIFVAGYVATTAPVTKTGDFTWAATENWIVVNQAATTTVTLPAAASFTGRDLKVKTIQNQTVVSASSNVVPLVGGAAGTAILSGTAGKWATLVSDGTNWIIMAGN